MAKVKVKCPCGAVVPAARTKHRQRIAGEPAAYCSNACRQRAYRERNAVEVLERDRERKRAERGG